MKISGVDLSDLADTVKVLAHSKYAIAVAIFLFWMVACDEDSLLSKSTQSAELSTLEAQKSELLHEIEQDKRKMSELRNNRQSLEKFAREEYFMKRDDETIFIIK